MQRRQFLRTLGAGSATAVMGMVSGCTRIGPQGPKVVVVGGGYGGATAAKYVRMWSDYGIDVTLVEPNASFVSCPLSNLVLGGSKTMADITIPYDTLAQHHGVKRVRDRVANIDAEKHVVQLANGSELRYDRLILSPGVDFIWDALPGMNTPAAQDKVLHAWKAGPQTLALRKQLEAMPDGGVFAIAIPLAPYRCPPAPYERACQVAHYFSKTKPRAKLLILDANDDVTSKGPLFKNAWEERYQGIVEYRPKHTLVDVDVAEKTLKFEFDDDLKADVLNVLPPMRAGEIAVKAGLATVNQRWCEVDFLTHEARGANHIHVLGDSIQVAPLMPKSGHMANQHAKVCAAAVVALLTGQQPNDSPIYNNTCYSFVSDEDAMHVSSVHRYDREHKTMLTVPGSGGLSLAANKVEGRIAFAWARNIWADTLA